MIILPGILFHQVLFDYIPHFLENIAHISPTPWWLLLKLPPLSFWHIPLFFSTFILFGIRSYTRLTPCFVFGSSQAFIKVLGPCIIQCVDIVHHKGWHRREEMPTFNPPLTPAWGNSYLSQRIIIQNSRHRQCLHQLLYILDSICFHKCFIKWIKI